jgi:hypothetical protein
MNIIFTTKLLSFKMDDYQKFHSMIPRSINQNKFEDNEDLYKGIK